MGRVARRWAAARVPGGRPLRAGRAGQPLAGGHQAALRRRAGAAQRPAPLQRRHRRRAAHRRESQGRDRRGARPERERGGRAAAGRGAAPRADAAGAHGRAGLGAAGRPPLRVPGVRAGAGQRHRPDAVGRAGGPVRALGPDVVQGGRRGAGQGAGVRERAPVRRRRCYRGASSPDGAGRGRRHLRGAAPGRHVHGLVPPGGGQRRAGAGDRRAQGRGAAGATVDLGNVAITTPTPSPGRTGFGSAPSPGATPPRNPEPGLPQAPANRP